MSPSNERGPTTSEAVGLPAPNSQTRDHSNLPSPATEQQPSSQRRNQNSDSRPNYHCLDDQHSLITAKSGICVSVERGVLDGGSQEVPELRTERQDWPEKDVSLTQEQNLTEIDKVLEGLALVMRQSKEMDMMVRESFDTESDEPTESAVHHNSDWAEGSAFPKEAERTSIFIQSRIIGGQSFQWKEHREIGESIMALWKRFEAGGNL
jgi:hypothetical protein